MCVQSELINAVITSPAVVSMHMVLTNFFFEQSFSIIHLVVEKLRNLAGAFLLNV